MAALDFGTPDLAVRDVNLGAETSFAVALRLTQTGVPLIFATGYGDDLAIPAEYAGFPVVKKPYTAAAIARAVAGSSDRELTGDRQSDALYHARRGPG